MGKSERPLQRHQVMNVGDLSAWKFNQRAGVENVREVYFGAVRLC